MNNNVYLFCVRCKKNARFICERCSDPYCTKTCQIMDWPFHRKICFPMPPLVEIPNDRNMIPIGDARNNESLALTYNTNSQNQHRFVPKNNNNNNGRRSNNCQRSYRSQTYINPVGQGLCELVDSGNIRCIESKEKESAATQKCSPTDLQKWNKVNALRKNAEQPNALNNSDEIMNLGAIKTSDSNIPLSTKGPLLTPKRQLNWVENVNEQLQELEELMSNDSKKWQKPFPLDDDTFVTVVYFVDSPTTNCWVVQNKHTTKRNCLQDEMKRLHCNDELTEIHKVIINEVYSVRYKDTYYRGECVYQVNSKEVLFQLIDVGLTFQTQLNAVRNLDSRLKTINALALEINWEKSMDVNIGQILRINRFSVDATGAMNVKLGQAEPIKQSTNPSIEIKTLPLPENVPLELFCLDYSNIEKGYISACIHDPEKIESINRLSDKIHDYLASHQEKCGEYFPKRNEICLAYHDTEEQWYRAECIGEMSAGRFEVIFLDYGTTRVVKSSDLRESAPEFNQPAIMHFCSIKGIPPKSTNELVKKIIAFFNENPFFTITSAKYDDDGVVIVDCPALLNAIR